MKRKKEWVPYALGNELPELVLKNANVVDVFSKRVRTADVAIHDGRIVGVGEYRGRHEVNLTGRYVCPGLIDAHVHIESSMTSPGLFSRQVLPYGTTTVIADPHEIVNVAGEQGMEYMLRASEGVPVNIYFMLPSCVPINSLEHNGAVYDAAQMKLLCHHPRVLGLGEVMDCPGVLSAKADLLKKIELMQHGIIDGHAPSITGNELQAYRLAGVQTDHECATYEEALERVQAGFLVQIREGSAARNLEAIVSGALKDGLPFDRFAFCTDDLHLDDVARQGHIDHNIRKSIRLGLDPITAICCATIQPARFYGLRELGAVAAGYRADLIVLDDLEEFRIVQVYKDGVPASERMTRTPLPMAEPELTQSVRVPAISAGQLALPAQKEFPVITLVPGEILTRLECLDLPGENGVFEPEGDLLKAVVVQRHSGSGQLGVGVVKGFGLKNGAIASTIAHDSHNLIVIGDNDADILCAIDALRACQGGYVVCSGGKALQVLPLLVAGLFTEQADLDVAAAQHEMVTLCRSMGVPETLDPFQNLSFLSLCVIPEIRLTDSGIFSVIESRFLTGENRSKNA
ncbi:adenine deaminase [Faecalispora anaeroviscerum]|uniref:adenine deaminase n=1 Tax=Faecalispora anaeroviscerum TaxID=2991836 RepID=UPI0024BA2568|nr:adenine deaminase [Faecalispora anaeroviscerum]